MPIPVCPDCGHPWSRHRESVGKGAFSPEGKELPRHQDEVCLECLYGPQAPAK